MALLLSFFAFIVGFPGGSVVNNLPANSGDAGDVGSVPGLGRYPGEEMAAGSSILPGKSHGQRDWRGTAHGAAQNQTGLSD